MDVPRALAQIEAIHEQLAKGEIYRGYRSLPVAASGLIGIGAAWLQPAGAAWVVRRKGDPVVSERASMAAGKKAGLVDVKVVSFSDTHTAEKYVIPVGKRASAARTSTRSPRTRGSRPSRDRT